MPTQVRTEPNIEPTTEGGGKLPQDSYSIDQEQSEHACQR